MDPKNVSAPAPPAPLAAESEAESPPVRPFQLEPVSEPHPLVPPIPARPWTRFWARHLDYLIFALGLTYSTILLPDWISRPITELHPVLLIVGVIFLWIFLEATLLSTWGTTPGKWLFHASVGTGSGHLLNFSRALKRSFSVWIRGMGVGILPLTPFVMLRSYGRLSTAGHTTWDSQCGTVIHYHPAGAWRLIMALVGIPALVGLFIVAPWKNEIDSYALEASTEVETIRRRIDTWVADSGGTLRPLTDVSEGKLRAGELRKIPFTLEGEFEAVAIAGCDTECLDLDLAVVSQEGNTVAVDQESDARPITFFSSEHGTSFDLVVSMLDCKSEPCSYALQVLSLANLGNQSGSGTCFSVSPDGLVMTANHVVEDAKEIKILFPNGDEEDAKVVRSSANNDIALLQTSRTTDDYLTFAVPDGLSVGDPVFTIGFPATEILGTEPKFTDGSISAMSGPQGEHGLLQMSVPIQPGNSGGPLLNEQGQVVAVVTAMAQAKNFERETGALPQAVNWAVKSAYAWPILNIPPQRPLASSRHDAIERAGRAVCLIESKS